MTYALCFSTVMLPPQDPAQASLEPPRSDDLFLWPTLMYDSRSNIVTDERRLEMTRKVFLVQSEGLGRGDERLGLTLMASFLSVLGESEKKPSTIVFWNTGVRLVCEGSQVIDSLKWLEEQGVEILACTTCLEYFNLKDKHRVGRPTNMLKSIDTMMAYDVISL